MGQCSQTDIPVLNLEEDECNGVRTSTNCITTPVAFTELEIEIGGTQTEINQALYTALLALTARVEELEP